MILQNPIPAADRQLIDLQGDFKLLTEWAESTAKEKMGLKREKKASNRATEVNSSGRKTLLFQGTLANRPEPERQFLPSAVGGGRGTVVEHSLCEISKT
jgi:hypothetical protein